MCLLIIACVYLCQNSIKDGCKNTCKYECRQKFLTVQALVQIHSCMSRLAFSIGRFLQFIYE